MSKCVFKYPVKPDVQCVRMPAGAEILTVQNQRGTVWLWALVDSNAELEDRYITIIPTGEEVPYVGKYISTFQLENGTMVFHAFESDDVPHVRNR